MPANLLILPLLAGFYFVHNCDRFRFRAQQLDGYRMLLYCSFAGAILLVLSRLIVWTIERFPQIAFVRSGWTSFAPIPWLGTSVGALLLALVLPLVLNFFTDAEEARAKEIRDNGDSLMQLLQRADVDERLVSITLASRKWYAGYVAEAPNLRPSEKYFNILPILSGYRDKDTLVARRALSYEKILLTPGVNGNDFVITLPLADVRSANLFDPAVYEDHFAEEAVTPAK